MSTASTTPPKRSRGERQQAVVGADEDAVVLGRAQRDRAPLAADLGVDDREMHARRAVRQRAAQDERAGAHVVARDAVGDVDDARLGRDARDHAVADPDEVVGEAVVGEERDRALHRASTRSGARERALRLPGSRSLTPCGAPYSASLSRNGGGVERLRAEHAGARPGALGEQLQRDRPG